MPLIKNRQVVEDTWALVDEETAVEALPAGNIIVPLALWLEQKAALLATRDKLGVWLDNDSNVEHIADDVDKFEVIALNFPIFRDGRGFSIAQRLRQRYHYRGELRAIGQVMADQLYFMERVGFNAFSAKDNDATVNMLAAFDMISVKYQAANDEPRPLYLRR